MRTLSDFGVVGPVAEATPNVLRELLQASMERRDLISLAGGLPAEELFDVEGLEEASRAVFRSNARSPLQYNATDGLGSLRARLAALTDARGISTGADSVYVTSGSQQAIDVVTRCLVSPGDVVLVERPTFITALQTFRAAQAHLMGLACDDEGPTPEALEEAVAAARAAGRRVKVIYLVPTFSNPAGAVMSLMRRKAILAIAVREGLTILEDDPYGELWFKEPPPPPIRALAADGAQDHVIYVSSLSKIVAPGLRLGWALLPPVLTQAFRLVKSTADIHSSVVAQAIADAYLSLDRLPARTAAARSAYARKGAALASALRESLGGRMSFGEPPGGMFLWARLVDGPPAVALSRHAVAAAGVSVVPGDPFYADEPEHDRIRLSFSQGSRSGPVRGREPSGVRAAGLPALTSAQPADPPAKRGSGSFSSDSR